MKNLFKTYLFPVLVLLAIATGAQAAFTLVGWFQITGTPTTLAGYGITDAATTGELSAHVASSTDVHGTVGAVVGASGAQSLYYKTLTDTTNHISGNVVDSGTVAEARIDAAIARDTEIPGNASFSFLGLNDTDDYAGQGGKALRVKAGADGIEYYTPSAGVTFKRAEATIGGVATTTVTFINDVEGNAVNIGVFGKCVISINGVDQAYSNFTKTTAKVIESTQGTIPSGALVTLKQVD